MQFKHVRTGPFRIEKVIEDDPKYLIVEFDDINPVTKKKSQRKMKKAEPWPPELAEKLSEKVSKLKGEEVMVVTSQTTKEWSTHDWFCDVETLPEYESKEHFASTLAADGKSELSNPMTLVYCGLLIIDCSRAKEFFKNENEGYEVFFHTMKEKFEAAYNNREKRDIDIDEDIFRIRLMDRQENTGSRSGFRVVLWRVFNKEKGDIDYFILLKVDRKSLEKKFPDKKGMLSIKKGLEQQYKGQNLKEQVEKAWKAWLSANSG